METNPTPSSAHNPDLDWSQIRETVLMLSLAVTLIKSAMKDGDRSVETLINSFTSITGGIHAMSAAIADLGGDAAHANEPLNKTQMDAKNILQSTCASIQDQVQQSIVAFQFYDFLTQRLSHVSDSLSYLSDLVSNQSRLYNPYEWKSLQEKIKSQYSIKMEKEMFNDLLKGMSIEQVIAKHHDENKDSSASGDVYEVEFF